MGCFENTPSFYVYIFNLTFTFINHPAIQTTTSENTTERSNPVTPVLNNAG